jgi:hypothetical protein
MLVGQTAWEMRGNLSIVVVVRRAVQRVLSRDNVGKSAIVEIEHVGSVLLYQGGYSFLVWGVVIKNG